MSLTCMQCGSPLRVVIHGGEFHVRKGSTLEVLNFEKVQKIDFETAEKIDNDVMLQVDVECSSDPNHMVFGWAATSIKNEIYKRIEKGAKRLRN